MLRERPAAAVAWLERLLAGVQVLGKFPHRGRMVPEVARQDIREIMVRPYRVLYRVDTKRVIVLTVRHMRRAFDPTEAEG
jgi:plasmid stabilization system protein ParE